MSMTLLLWKAPHVDDPDKAEALLGAWYEHGDDSSFEPSPDVAAVRERLRATWPDDSSSEKHSNDSCPWADLPIEDNDRLLALHLRWGADGRVLADITALARIHGLILYDPQGPDIILPTDPIEELTNIPPFKLVDWLKISAIVLVLSGLTYAAAQIPVGWLRWPAVVIAGFFASAALFVLGCMIFGRRITESDNRRT